MRLLPVKDTEILFEAPACENTAFHKAAWEIDNLRNKRRDIIIKSPEPKNYERRIRSEKFEALTKIDQLISNFGVDQKALSNNDLMVRSLRTERKKWEDEIDLDYVRETKKQILENWSENKPLKAPKKNIDTAFFVANFPKAPDLLAAIFLLFLYTK